MMRHANKDQLFFHQNKKRKVSETLRFDLPKTSSHQVETINGKGEPEKHVHHVSAAPPSLTSCRWANNDETSPVSEAIKLFDQDDHDRRSLAPTERHRKTSTVDDGNEFDILNKIGEGTYGVVYRARHKMTREIVALKKVKKKSQLGSEVKILASLDHPSIVHLKRLATKGRDVFMVMEYAEHDLKALMEMTMNQPFSQSEVKCLMLQLLRGVKYLHDNRVVHQDLKTSNLLLHNRGELKICDFGLARRYDNGLSIPYTQLVVTLWYRAPELLLGAKQYTAAIDMWSVGCVMAELLSRKPLFDGKTEIDQLGKIFSVLGTPNAKIWPGSKVNKLVKHYKYNYSLRQRFPKMSFIGSVPTLSDAGLDLLNGLLTYDPEKRMTAEEALNHGWFCEDPLPKAKEFMPTFPQE